MTEELRIEHMRPAALLYHVSDVVHPVYDVFL